MKTEKENPTIGLIVGSREFFPDEISFRGGKRVKDKLENRGYEVLTVFSSEEKVGLAVDKETSKEYAELFKEREEDLDGILITLPNFGDEKSVVEVFKISGVDVPAMVHAFPDELSKMDRENRRDAFCGKISVCNNLKQAKIDFTNTTKHVESPNSKAFEKDIDLLANVGRTVDGLKDARAGVVGLRPNPFQTVRYSEKILEGEGISVENISLMKTLEEVGDLEEDNSDVQDFLEEMEDGFKFELPEKHKLKTAKLGAYLLNWIEENDLDTLSFQCWPEIEEYYGISPCGAMSILSELHIPSACESDVMGSISMYALQLAEGQPAAIIDLNNNYGDEKDKFVAFHCSNFPPSCFEGPCELGYHSIQEAYGACNGKIKPGPVTLLRIDTNDTEGTIEAYVAEGEITDEELDTFGGYGVLEVEGMEALMDLIVNKGFAHHAGMVGGHVGNIIEESLGNYLGWEVYRHNP